jgi:hypothetical protein
MEMQEAIELEVLRAVERESCVHLAGVAQCFPGTTLADVEQVLRWLAANQVVEGASLEVVRGEVHDLRLTERGESRLAASRPDAGSF